MNQAIVTKKQLISLSYIIGGIFFMVFAGKIGYNGVGYLAMTLELLCVFVFLVSEDIADFVAKMIRGKKSKGLYKDAFNVKRRVMVIQTITGVVLSVTFFLLADFFAETVFQISYISICMRILAPIIFLKSMETAFLGNFQSSGSQMPTVICVFFRQIFFFLFGNLFVNKLTDYGTKVSGLLVNEDFAGLYGAIGLCISILIAELLVFLFQVFLYFISDHKKEQKRCKEGHQKTEDLKSTLYYYYGTVIILFGSQFLFRLPILLGMIYGLHTLNDSYSGAHLIGNYYGIFLFLCYIPVLLVEMGSHVMRAKLSGYVTKQDSKGVRDTIASGLHYCVIFAVYFALIFLTLSEQMVNVFTGSQNQTLDNLMKLGAVLIIVSILARFGIGLLKSMNQKKLVLLCNFFGAVAAVVTCFIGKKNGFEVYDYLLYAMIFANGVIALASIGITAGGRRFNTNIIQTLIVPLVCGSVVGLLIMLISNMMTPHLGNLVCLILCVIFGFVLYIFLLGLTRNIHEHEISAMYGELGKKIVGLIFK